MAASVASSKPAPAWSASHPCALLQVDRLLEQTRRGLAQLEDEEAADDEEQGTAGVQAAPYVREEDFAGLRGQQEQACREGSAEIDLISSEDEEEAEEAESHPRSSFGRR